MKNIIPYRDDTLTFHKDVVDRKNNRSTDLNYQNRQASFFPDLKVLFDEYDDRFIKNDFENLFPKGYNGQDKVDLLNLYSYSSQKMQELKIKLTTDESNRVMNTCQNCAIGEVGSFDHYLPKDEFPEFVVNPKNLIPSCTKCNGSKSTTWLEAGKRKFLNLYTDVLPVEQYLFVDLKVIVGEIEIEFIIENRNHIDVAKFDIIKSHYQKLNLLQRFKENCTIIVSELDVQIRSFKALLSLDQIKDAVLEQCNTEKVTLGFNNWKLVLRESLVFNEYYLDLYK